ncbi:DOMON-like domain-containing protein [Candidatus Methylomicrobium oryzae]|jgi:hypothetical protein|uniref:DOMON-like domain-containing protein n=1 Tax=Candidatus Methylomicrobium oryzae TaxID=2802053 RepID=UPI0019205E6A|nr:DOMON-like domain-containing protein [Methylomicrobium sp. RS1]MBL1263602.1 DOMON-like domain-containing protein [Methylomicrobium sp. RS1]
MTIKILHCHPATPNDSIGSLSVEIERDAGTCLTLRYRLAGNLEKILIPAAKPSAVGDGLWQHTCFEAFATAAGTSAYREFNFSPSGEWAAYAFGDYRERMPWSIGTPPVIEVSQPQDQLLLTARIAADDLPAGARLHLGLTAVIESIDGNISYWALHHPAEKPDFHDCAGFVYPLD